MTLMEAFKDKEQDKNLRCFYIPGINLFYTSVFEDPPSVLVLDRMLSHLSLLSALMLTIAMSFPMKFNFGEFEAARERFTTTQYRHYDTFESLYIEAMGYNTMSCNCLVAAVSILVVFSAYGRLDPDWEGREARRVWWKLARWPVIGSFGKGTKYDWYCTRLKSCYILGKLKLTFEFSFSFLFISTLIKFYSSDSYWHVVLLCSIQSHDLFESARLVRRDAQRDEA